MFAWFKSLFAPHRKRHAHQAEEPQVITLDGEGEEIPGPSGLSNGHASPAEQPPSKRQRLNPALTAQRFVKGRETWSAHRHLLRHRRGRKQFRPSSQLSPSVYPSSPPNGILHFLNSSHQPMEQTVETVDLAEEEEVTEDEEELVVLSPPEPPRLTFTPRTAPPVITIPNGGNERSEGVGLSPRTPDHLLVRKPLTRSPRSSLAQPSFASPVLRNGVDLAERERFRQLLNAQHDASQPSTSAQGFSTSKRMLGHLTPAPSPIGQFLFSSDEQESTSLKTRISDFLRDQERRGGAKPKMGKVLRHHPYATSTPRPPRFNSASPLPKLDDLLHQTDLPSLHASFPSLLDRPQRPRMSDFHDRTHFQPYAPSLQYLPHYQPPPTHTHFPQPPCCPNYYQNPYYPVPMTSVQNYQPHYAPSFSEFHNPAPPSLDEYRAMVAAASRRRERPVWESQSLEDSLSDIRRVLNELVPGDASEDSGRPSTSASPHSPQSQGSGGVITLDDGPLEGDSGSREESGGKGRLSTEYLVRMEHGLDVNPRGILRTLDGWRDKLSVRDIHADNLQRELKLFAELRLKKDRLADKDLRERLRLQGIVIPEIELLDLEEAEEEPEELPELPEEAEDLIQSALNAPDKKKIVEMNNTPITPHDLKTLIGLNWLNDEVMNYYITMIQERSKKEGMAKIHCFNTFFYPKLDSGGHGSLKRWTRRIDIFAMDLVLAPIHLGVHWCLAVMDLVNKEVRYYDSMGGPNDHCLHLLKDYLEAEHQDKKKSPLDMSEWKLINVKDIPQQKNGSDCGMFSLKFADYISAGKPIDFTQEDMPYFRRRMMYEILTSQLMW